MGPEVEERETDRQTELTTRGEPAQMRVVALSRLKTCCVRMFGEICSSKVSSVIDSPFLVADSMPGGWSTRAERRGGEQHEPLSGPLPHRRALAVPSGCPLGRGRGRRGAVCCADPTTVLVQVRLLQVQCVLQDSAAWQLSFKSRAPPSSWGARDVLNGLW